MYINVDRATKKTTNNDNKIINFTQQFILLIHFLYASLEFIWDLCCFLYALYVFINIVIHLLCFLTLNYFLIHFFPTIDFSPNKLSQFNYTCCIFEFSAATDYALIKYTTLSTTLFVGKETIIKERNSDARCDKTLITLGEW